MLCAATCTTAAVHVDLTQACLGLCKFMGNSSVHALKQGNCVSRTLIACGCAESADGVAKEWLSL